MLTARSTAADGTLQVPEAPTVPAPNGPPNKLVKRKTSLYSLAMPRGSTDQGRPDLRLEAPATVEKKHGHKKHGFSSWFGKRRELI